MKRKKILIITLIILGLSIGATAMLFWSDHSYTNKQYQKLGIPGLDKMWDKTSYLQSIAALGGIKRYHPMSLPKKYSLKSGRLFRNLVNPENLKFARNKQLSLASRARDLQYFSIYQNSLKDIYTDKLSEKQYYSTELIDIYIFGLSVYNTMLETAAEINNSNGDDTRGMQAGSESVVLSYCSQLMTLFKEQNKVKIYSSRQLIRLSNALSKSIVANKSWYSPEEKETISKELAEIVQNSGSEYIRREYSQVINLLEK